MRKVKKLASVLLAVALMLAMSVTAFAAETGYTVTIDDGDVSGASYAAYKLMDVTTGTTTDSEGKETTTFAYTVNSKYSAVLQSVTGAKTDEAVIEYVAALSTDAATIQFADDLYAAIKKAGLTVDATAQNNVFSNMKGYYLIVETATGTTSSGTYNESYSSAILRTVYTNETVFTKEDVPELTKKVWETDDSTYSSGAWQDGADYDIGDPVPFRLSATISDYYDDYDVYSLTFHDTLSTGLTFDGEDAVHVYVVNGTTATELDASDYTVSTDTNDGCSFHVTVTDLKNLETNATVYSTSVIRVEYTATLNDKAVIGRGSTETPNNQGNPNVAYLEYSNNPYDDTSTGRTPEDKVTVFTFKLDVNKYDDTGELLNGAGFTLYKWYATGSGASDGEWKAVGSEQVYSDGSAFAWKGLDSGEYKIVETTVPSGYTKAADISFEVVANYQTSSDNPLLNALQVNITQGSTSVLGTTASYDVQNGTITMGIVNKAGNSLPRTGGIGTTIFYIVGGVMVAGAVVLLITRKRMGENE